jgi:phosphonate transport system substrate-binding protein
MLFLAGLAVAALTAVPARADYRDSVPVLRIGVVEAQLAAVDPAKLAAVDAAFADALGVPVEIVRMGSYAALIDAHASGRVGYAIHSTRSFAATEAVCGCIRAFRTPVAADGSTGFRSVLVVRDSVAKPVSELKVAYSREDSVSGWLIPQQAIRTGGLDAPQLVRAGSVAAVIALYAGGEVDGFFAWIPDSPGDAGADVARVFGGWNMPAIAGAEPLRMLWSSQRIPYGPHAVLRSLPDDLVEALGGFLDRIPASAPGLLDIFEPVYGGGYVAPDPEDYRNVRGLVEGLAGTDAAALPAR